MATHDNTIIGSMLDVVKFQLKGNEAIQNVANTLAERSDFFRLVPAYPANSGTFHKGLRSVSLPTGYLVDVGGSWKGSKADFEPVMETLCTIRSAYECNRDMFLNVAPEQGQALLRANKASHIEAINQGMDNIMLTGPTTPDLSAIVGIKQRKPYTTYDHKFCFSAGGSGSDLRSAWLIKPGIDTFHALYNQYHPTLGVQEEDMGINRVDGLGTSSDEHRYDICIEFMLQKGLHIVDQRAVKRICNVACGVTDDPGVDLVNTIIDAATINTPKGGNLMTYDANMRNVEEKKSPWILFCDERLYSKLVRAQNNKTFVFSSAENIYRTELPMIGKDIIIARWDALNRDIGSGETVVAAA
jgi:hypothetical protein